MKKMLLLLCLTFLPFTVDSDSLVDPAIGYIAKYSEIAVREMYRSGVPASITLAQGLLESGKGLGYLAIQANNHFGIKCHQDWQGERVYYDDDEKGECFRKYPTPEESFVDHSNFLRFKPRYASLFEYNTADYKSWAYGLKSAGYATDPKYAEKLIAIVERYDLSQYDVKEERQKMEIPETPSELEKPERFISKGAIGKYSVTLKREILQKNGIPFIYARAGETYKSIAENYDLFTSELEAINDVRSSHRELSAGDVVYLHRKASKASKGLDLYVCQEGDDLWKISQRFAIRLSSLMKMNGIKTASITLQEDDTIYLRPNKGKQNKEEKQNEVQK